MKSEAPQQSKGRQLGHLREFIVASRWPVGILLVLLGLLFWKALLNPDYVVFSNDGPYGGMMTAYNQMPEGLTGVWNDQNYVGSPDPAQSPNISGFLRCIVSPLVWSKIVPAFSLFVLGFWAWWCFRLHKFSPLVCVLAAVAAALNSDFVGTAAWGVVSQPIAFGLNFLAIGALADQTSGHRWLRVILAGFAVGLGITEAFDIGALFSLFVGGYVVFQSLSNVTGIGRQMVAGIGRLSTVAVCAAFIAAAALATVVSTQIQGVAGTQQDAETKAARWSFATQYSIPKVEAFGIAVPGLFGFRHDTPGGGDYWGRGGSDPSWDEVVDSDGQRGRPAGAFRAGAGSHYAGVLVILLALCGIVQSFRKQGSPFTVAERRMVWFWSAAAVAALLLMFGRFAPFYELFYKVPYLSTIRNPAKFVHIAEWALIFLFAYGAEALCRVGFSGVAVGPSGLKAHWKSWWAKAARLDRRWVWGSAALVVLVALSWLAYASSRDALERHIAGWTNLQYAAMGRTADQAAVSEMAAANARHSIGQVGRTLLFLTPAVILVAITLSGYFRGGRAKVGVCFFVLLLAIDLFPVNRPWVIFVNHKVKYESNPVIEFLRQQPYEHRVAIFPLDRFLDFRRLPREMMPLVQLFSSFAQLYGIEWTQHLFLYNNIQTLDIRQEPRVPQDKAAFEAAMITAPPLRRWELTNTRFLLGPSAFVESLNQQLDMGKGRFSAALRFDLAAKSGVDQSVPQSEQVTALTNTNGQLAVISFAGALPRAKLYANWHVSTNNPAILREWVKSIQTNVPMDWGQALASQSDTDLATLRELVDKSFDPSQTVLLAEPLPLAPGTNQNLGEVKIDSYNEREKRILLTAKTTEPCVLLLNDKYDPNWKVFVDGQPVNLLRCNFLMRGVFLDKAGDHRVEFRYEPSLTGLWMSLGSIAVAIGLLAYLGFVKPRA